MKEEVEGERAEVEEGGQEAPILSSCVNTKGQLQRHMYKDGGHLPGSLRTQLESCRIAEMG